MKKRYKLYNIYPLALGCILFLTQCQRQNQLNTRTTGNSALAQNPGYKITQEFFGTTKSGTDVNLYTLQNSKGTTVKITNYGGIVTSLITPDKNGRPGDVVLGFDKFEDYELRNPFFGALVGRYGNRIANGKFTLEGKEYTLAVNNGPNHLHGGVKGFDKVVWQARELPRQNALELTYISPDGEEGYPGTLTAVVTYTLTPENALRIDYKANTNKPTPINLTNHSYFNLSGGTEPNILAHELVLHADNYTVVDKSLIPTGEIKPVVGSALDFRTVYSIGSRIKDLEGGGYDHNYVINRKGNGIVLAAQVTEPTSGRVMDVLTTQPGVQFYTANFLSSRLTGKNGQPFQKYGGFCLETQHYPDSPNQPAFPSTILRPGETHTQTTVYKFSIQKKI